MRRIRFFVLIRFIRFNPLNQRVYSENGNTDGADIVDEADENSVV